MRMGLYSLRDVKASSFLQPVGFPTTPLAFRWFQDLLGDAQSMIAKHPGDFALHLLGEYDTETGELFSRDGGVQFLAYATELIAPGAE